MCFGILDFFEIHNIGVSLVEDARRSSAQFSSFYTRVARYAFDVASAATRSLVGEPSQKSVLTRIVRTKNEPLDDHRWYFNEKYLLIGGIKEGLASGSRKEICFGKHSWCLGNRSSSLSISDEPPALVLLVSNEDKAITLLNIFVRMSSTLLGHLLILE